MRAPLKMRGISHIHRLVEISYIQPMAKQGPDTEPDPDKDQTKPDSEKGQTGPDKGQIQTRARKGPDPYYMLRPCLGIMGRAHYYVRSPDNIRLIMSHDRTNNKKCLTLASSCDVDTDCPPPLKS